MRKGTIFISPCLKCFEVLRDIVNDLKYIIIDNNELIKSENTLVIAKPLRETSRIEASTLINKYQRPILFIKYEEYDTSPFANNQLIHIIDYTDNKVEFKNKIVTYLKLQEVLNNFSDNKIWLNGILNSTTEGIIGININGLIEFINPVAQNILGIEEQNALSKPAKDILKFKNTDFSQLKQNCNLEDEVYNKIAKEFNPISGNLTSVIDRTGNISGQIIIIKSIGEMKKLFDRVKYQATHDSLTGLYNRQSFIDSIDEYITYSKIDNTSHGLIIVSVDKFKIINDTCGHLAGDELLRKISYVLRQSDQDNKFKKARIGGDEFGILLKDSSFNEIKRYTKTVQRKISTTDFIWGDKEFSIKCSFGLTTIDNNSENHHTVLAALDDACAIAKEKGGNKIEIYNKIDDKYNKRRGEMLWIHRLKDAISKDKFTLYYQEIKSIKKEDFKKVEILLRLKGDDGNIISPIDFIPPAERYGLMPEIDRLVIAKSINFCKKILDNKSIKEGYIFSVNISGTSIADKSLPQYIQSTFQKYRVPPTLFCFEITETATISNLDIAKSFIKNLKRIGCTFSLDDFGSGFSNFSYLKSLDVDYLKIDGSLIHNIAEKPINKAIVESINNIGHAMKLKTIAEFVKDKKILNILVNIGVDYLQGYELGKPTPIEALLNSD